MSLSARDAKVLWHPYTQMLTAEPAIGIVRGEGARLYDEQGRHYIDAISSWWVNLHGHAHPYIGARIRDQLNTLEHVLFAGFTHEPAVRLAERLLTYLPGHSRIFYSDDGSTAVEVALKMAFQFWRNRGERRHSIVALRGGYHGDTFGSMSASERGVFSAAFHDLLFEVHFIDPPVHVETSLAQLEAITSHSLPAAFIFEPLIQGAAGMHMYPPDGLDTLLAFCRDRGILRIADEVMTGFGRTGKMFATDYLTKKPDLLCLSKGLTGGFLPLGVTSCNSEVFECFLSHDIHKALFHGHSYTANPLACAAALASLELLEEQACRDRMVQIAKQQKQFVHRLERFSACTKARALGTISALDFVTDQQGYGSALRDKLYRYYLDHGILLRPLGNIVYTMPPYCISDPELEGVFQIIERSLEEITFE